VSVFPQLVSFSQGDPHSPVRDHLLTSSPASSFPPFLSTLPKSVGQEESTLTNLSRYLRSSPAATTPNPMEKMLTPVEEKPAAECEHDQDHALLLTDDEDDDVILSSVSNKLDNPSLSRSESTFSGTGPAFFIESEKDSAWEVGSVEGKRSGDLRLHDEQKGLSQSSEESNAFEENIPEHMRTMLNEIASSAEETPLQKSLDSGMRQRHSVLSMSEMPSVFQRTTRGGGSPQKSQSLRGRYSGMYQQQQQQQQQHQPPTPSSSCHSFIVTSSSFSERSRGSKKKYSISEKYAKYEQCRSEKELNSKGKEEEETKVKEEPLQSDEKTEPVIDSEQQNENFETAGEVENDVTDESAITDDNNEDTIHSKSDNAEERKDEEEDMGQSPEGAMESLNKRILEVRECGATAKQCDSGIDDTPDSSKTFKEGVRRLSMPPSDDDIHMTDGKPLSQVAAFASRESGIADSPVPEMPSDDVVFKTQKSVPERDQTSSLTRSQLRKEEVNQETDNSSKDNDDEFDEKGSIQLLGTPRHSSCVEIIVPEEGEDSDRVTPVVRRRVHSSYSIDRDRGSSVPRSLESPTFSRYARKPIRDRDSKVLLRASDSISPEGTGLRYRSISMDKIPISYMDSKSLRENDEFLEFRQKVKSDSIPSTSRDGTEKSKHPGISNSMSASFVSYSPPPQLIGAATVSGGGKSSAAIDGRPIARYSVTSPPESLSPQNSPSHVLHPTNFQTTSSSSLPTELSLSSPASSPMSRRSTKLGKGLKQKLKPALRVFKIASASSIDLRSSEILRQPPPIEEDEEGKDVDDLFASVRSCPSDERKIEKSEMRRRMRMVSPEAVDNERLKKPLSTFLRRSRSYEDVLELDEDEDVNEKSGRTKIGGLVVVPELKQKPRSKMLLGKMKKKKLSTSGTDSNQLVFKGSEVGKELAGDPEKSPALLAYGYLAQSDGSGMKNPKSSKKQRHRTPQYV